VDVRCLGEHVALDHLDEILVGAVAGELLGLILLLLPVVRLSVNRLVRSVALGLLRFLWRHFLQRLLGQGL